MRAPNEESRLCESCELQPAAVRYTLVTAKETITEWVCATCFDTLTARDAFDGRILHVVNLELDGQYDEALACLDEILEANRHLDHDQWVARSVAGQRAHILFEAGRYAETEEACKVWAQVGFKDVGDRWMHGTVTADALDALGRTRAGLAILEEALRHRDPREVSGAWGFLRDVATLSKKVEQPVDPSLRGLAEETAARNGVELPERESLGESILALAELIGGKDEPDEDEPPRP
jgi:tetratricopeptide (TPR) repeat protein